MTMLDHVSLQLDYTREPDDDSCLRNDIRTHFQYAWKCMMDDIEIVIKRDFSL